MNKSRFLIVFTALILAGTGCSEEGHHSEGRGDHHPGSEAHSHSHEHAESKFVDGKTDAGLWRTDSHTRASVQNLKSIAGYKPKDEEGYAALGKGLENSLNGLIQGCTMDGDAHEALHHWLMPLGKNIGDIAKAVPLDQKEKTRLALLQHLENFSSEFEN